MSQDSKYRIILEAHGTDEVVARNPKYPAPASPVNPDVTYFLKNGEEIMKGDEIWDRGIGEWIPCEATVGMKVNESLKTRVARDIESGDCKKRRVAAETLPTGYELMVANEVLPSEFLRFNRLEEIWETDRMTEATVPTLRVCNVGFFAKRVETEHEIAARLLPAGYVLLEEGECIPREHLCYMLGKWTKQSSAGKGPLWPRNVGFYARPKACERSRMVTMATNAASCLPFGFRLLKEGEVLSRSSIWYQPATGLWYSGLQVYTKRVDRSNAGFWAGPIPEAHTPPAGYKKVAKGDIIQAGDKFYHLQLGWTEVDELIGRAAGEYSKRNPPGSEHWTIIRVDVNPFAGWRVVEPGEVIRGCDAYWDGEHWTNVAATIGQRSNCTNGQLIRPAEPTPPTGYYLLKDGEVIKRGDKFLQVELTFRADIWLEAWTTIGAVVGDKGSKGAGTDVQYWFFARKIEEVQPPEGFRFLFPEERLQNGDMSLDLRVPGGWRATADFVFGHTAHLPKTFARKIVSLPDGWRYLKAGQLIHQKDSRLDASGTGWQRVPDAVVSTRLNECDKEKYIRFMHREEELEDRERSAVSSWNPLGRPWPLWGCSNENWMNSASGWIYYGISHSPQEAQDWRNGAGDGEYREAHTPDGSSRLCVLWTRKRSETCFNHDERGNPESLIVHVRMANGIDSQTYRLFGSEGNVGVRIALDGNKLYLPHGGEVQFSDIVVMRTGTYSDQRTKVLFHWSSTGDTKWLEATRNNWGAVILK